MNKKERRQADLKRHYEFLGRKQDGKKLSLKLLRIERDAHASATDYCNGDIDTPTWESDRASCMAQVLAAFGVTEIPGFFINGDPRGYALKIDDETVRKLPDSLRFHRDMGGTGFCHLR